MLHGMAHDVLVVEDEEDIAVPLMRTLEREGYDVSRVSGGAEAVAFVVEEGPAVVILDLGLPDMDGIDVCRQTRAGGYLGGIIMVTARAGELDRVVGLADGRAIGLGAHLQVGRAEARHRDRVGGVGELECELQMCGDIHGREHTAGAPRGSR